MRNVHEVALWSQHLRQLHDLPVREQHLFCNLSPSAVQRLNDITSPAVYPRGAMLFIEGQQGRGTFVLCTGKAKLSTASRGGKTIITKISEHGDVLGLNATISNRPYEVTAEMVVPGQANFIAADALLQFLHDYAEVALRVAQQLSRNYYSAYEEIRTLGLTNSPGQKFAKLLLDWSAERGDSSHSLQMHLVLTHEEIAEDDRHYPRDCQPLGLQDEAIHPVNGFQSCDP
jgi:CRP/FNR family transcriptional regulator, cyclic AMP receptor protein